MSRRITGVMRELAHDVNGSRSRVLFFSSAESYHCDASFASTFGDSMTAPLGTEALPDR